MQHGALVEAAHQRQLVVRQFLSQRADFSRLLAQGKSPPIPGVLQSVPDLCGINFSPKPEEARQAAFAFLRAVIDTLNYCTPYRGGVEFSEFPVG
jgi:hypothetical protein